jgi:hypothetical protein
LIIFKPRAAENDVVCMGAAREKSATFPEEGSDFRLSLMSSGALLEDEPSVSFLAEPRTSSPL